MAQLNFLHRVSAFLDDTGGIGDNDMVDTVKMMCERAVAIIEMVALQFEAGGRRCNDSLNESALSAAAHEIRDIMAVVDAYSSNSGAVYYGQIATTEQIIANMPDMMINENSASLIKASNIQAVIDDNGWFFILKPGDKVITTIKEKELGHDKIA
jgi:hypothetical protein